MGIAPAPTRHIPPGPTRHRTKRSLRRGAATGAAQNPVKAQERAGARKRLRAGRCPAVAPTVETGGCAETGLEPNFPGCSTRRSARSGIYPPTPTVGETAADRRG